MELGGNHGGSYHCVLVCIELFTRWAEVVPLSRQDGQSVAEAFIAICSRFGPPWMVRCDNGPEFRDHLVEALFEVFGVVVKHGAVRHPQSQGSAERFNRTLLTLIRKAVDSGSDWETELQMLLFYYRARPHSILKLSPMQAMFGWSPRELTVESLDAGFRYTVDSWAAAVGDRAARVRDYVEERLARLDEECAGDNCPYTVGDQVLLRRPQRSQKCLTPFESGWQVLRVVSPTTVVICTDDGSDLHR